MKANAHSEAVERLKRVEATGSPLKDGLRGKVTVDAVFAYERPRKVYVYGYDATLLIHDSNFASALTDTQVSKQTGQTEWSIDAAKLKLRYPSEAKQLYATVVRAADKAAMDGDRAMMQLIMDEGVLFDAAGNGNAAAKKVLASMMDALMHDPESENRLVASSMTVIERVAETLNQRVVLPLANMTDRAEEIVFGIPGKKLDITERAAERITSFLRGVAMGKDDNDNAYDNSFFEPTKEDAVRSKLQEAGVEVGNRGEIGMSVKEAVEKARAFNDASGSAFDTNHDDPATTEEALNVLAAGGALMLPADDAEHYFTRGKDGTIVKVNGETDAAVPASDEELYKLLDPKGSGVWRTTPHDFALHSQAAQEYEPDTGPQAAV